MYMIILGGRYVEFFKKSSCLRKVKKLTQKQASIAIGVDEENYQKLEFDTMEPDLQMLTRIADFYEVDAYDLKTTIIGGGEQVGASSRFDDPAPKIVGQNEKKSSGSMLVPTLKLKMGFCVGLTALFSFLLLLYFVCPLVSNSAELPYLGETYIKIRFVDCLSGEGFVLADAIIGCC